MFLVCFLFPNVAIILILFSYEHVIVDNLYSFSYPMVNFDSQIPLREPLFICWNCFCCKACIWVAIFDHIVSNVSTIYLVFNYVKIVLDTVFWHASLLNKVWFLILLKKTCSWPIRVVVCSIINICFWLIYIFPIHAMCFHYFRARLVTQHFTQLLSQLATWQVMSGGDVNPHGHTIFSSSLMAHHVTSCGKCCVKCCGTRIALFFFFGCCFWNKLWTLYDYPSIDSLKYSIRVDGRLWGIYQSFHGVQLWF